MRYFLGADLGGTKTHLLIADETGQAVGLGKEGPGNHQTIGYEGTRAVLENGLAKALDSAGLKVSQIAGAGFGIAGYDWPSQEASLKPIIQGLGMSGPWSIHNDAIAGLVAGASEGWGVAVVSGTGCNCWGWDRQRRREGRVTGYGILMGEAAGATELVFRAMQHVSFAWTLRGPSTALSEVFINLTGASDLQDLIEGYTEQRYAISPEAARLVFQTAENGDQVAQELIRWAGTELGELACSVTRQLEFEDLAFDVVLAGSMFDGGEALIEPMRQTILKTAPYARLVRLTAPPVLGAVLIGMEQGGLAPSLAIRQKLSASLAGLRQVYNDSIKRENQRV
jgi:N-acetylglucosamine kinase-like BadF-type ATPase